MRLLLITGIFMLFTISPEKEQSGSWAFNYPGDSFSETALLDLRYLNEDYAGQHGFISLSSDGESFVRGDGEAIRFWPVNGGAATSNMSDEELAFHARFLAKQGVNMNRWHGSINPSGEGSDLFDLDTAEVDDIWRFVAAMKKEGIYSTISPFWAHNGHMGGWIPEEWGIDGYSGKDEMWEVLYFNDRFKEAYKSWVKYLYTEKNPYTGMALKDDPAVALIQIKNEDGVFFWTMQMIKPELKQLVGELFAEWLVKKYGSMDKVLAAWDGDQLPLDNPDEAIFDLYGFWPMIQDARGGKAIRMADQMEFLAYRQRSFYKEIRDFYRDELGCKQLVNPNNWKSANPEKFEDLERFTYLDCEVPAVNRYFTPGHYGENNGWRIDPGHFYQGESCLKNPLKLPINIKQVSGKPFLVTESGWNFPQKHQSEAPMLISAYQSLTGHDAFYWFYISSPDYMEFPYFGFTKDAQGRHAMNRWTYSSPGGIAQFPAYALLYRKGYIREGETMIHEVRSLESMYQRETPLISEESSFDPNRDQLEGIQRQAGKSRVNPFAFLTGPVKVSYGGEESDSYVNEKMDQLIDMNSGTVKSVTGELDWDFHRGVFTMNSACAVGISGFLGEKYEKELGPLTIMADNHYLTLGAVSMDEKDLGSSRKILVQTGTSYLPTGWEEKADTYITREDTLHGYEIINTGKMPWLADNTEVSIHLNNKNIRKAYLLDLAGYVDHEIPVNIRKGKISLTLPENALYVILSE